MDSVAEGRLLRVFICESDHRDGLPLAEAIIDALRAAGIAGATVLRGVAGYGGSAVVHTTHVLRLCEDLPMVIEAVDTVEKVDAVLPKIRELVAGGMITTQEVDIHIPRRSH
jgi:PII-like signaling protein